MNDWKLEKLGNITLKIGSGATPRGGKNVYLDNGIPLIRSQNIYNGYFNHSGLAFLSERSAKELDNVIVKKNDNLINITGDSVCRSTIVPDNLINSRVNQHVMIIRPIQHVLHYRYLHYFLISPNTQKILYSFSDSGGTRKALTKEMVSELEIPLPSLTTQQKIADILGSLDDKIELNRQMNQTLEAMARAIFKSWFVDFDPVYAKMEGRDYPLPPKFMDLFPDELEESELGLIPKGWTVDKLGERFEFAYGKSLPENKRISGTYKVYGSNGEVGWHNEKLVDGPGIVIGRKGNPGIVTFVFDDFYPIDTTFYVKTDLPFLFSYYLLKNLKLKRLSADSAVPGLNRNIAYLEKFLFPPDGIQKIYEGVIEPLYEKIKENNYQSNTLINIKNILIPRLLIK